MSMIVVLILTSVLLELGGLSDLFHGHVSDSYLRSILSNDYLVDINHVDPLNSYKTYAEI